MMAHRSNSILSTVIILAISCPLMGGVQVIKVEQEQAVKQAYVLECWVAGCESGKIKLNDMPLFSDASGFEYVRAAIDSIQFDDFQLSWRYAKHREVLGFVVAAVRKRPTREWANGLLGLAATGFDRDMYVPECVFSRHVAEMELANAAKAKGMMWEVVHRVALAPMNGAKANKEEEEGKKNMESNVGRRIAAIRLLGCHGDKTVGADLRDLLRSPEDRIRLATRWALEDLKERFEESDDRNGVEIEPGPPTKARCFGAPLRRSEILFVIDASWWMRRWVDEEVANGKKRRTMLALACDEVLLTIRNLPADTRFNIFLYGTRVQAWRPESALANEDNILSAETTLKRIGAWGKRDLFGAFALALGLRGLRFGDSPDREDREVVLISGGLPRGGELVEPDLILRVLRDVHRARGTRVHAVSMWDRAQDDFLARLAKDTGGEFVRR